MPDIEILPDANAVAERAASLLVDALAATSGPVAVSLSGGATPERLYRRLAAEPWRNRLPWVRVHWFWSDERLVAPDHPDSNFGMARRAMLDAVPVERSHIHDVTTRLDPHAAAAAYEAELRHFYGAAKLEPARPLFEVSLLGMGEDGHTASLFAGSAALDERHHWTAAVTGARGDPRVTLTPPAINSSRLILMLVTGRTKRGILKRIAAGEALPAARIRPIGPMRWLADRTAAGPETRGRRRAP